MNKIPMILETGGFGLLKKRDHPLDIATYEQFFEIYKNSKSGWSTCRSILYSKAQQDIDDALTSRHTQKTDFIFALDSVVNYYEHSEPVEIEGTRYAVIEVLRTPWREQKRLAPDLYCEYVLQGDMEKAARVREKYRLERDSRNPRKTRDERQPNGELVLA